MIGREQANFYFQQKKIRSKLLGWYIWLFGYPDLHSQIRYRAIRSLIDVNRKSIDLGAGRCLLTIPLSKLIRRQVTAIIYGKEDIDLALIADKRRVLKIIEGDIADLSFIDEKFNQVLVLDVLEHVNDQKAMEQINKIAESGCLLIISVPAKNYNNVFSDNFAKNIGHLKDGYNKFELFQLLSLFGFDIINFKPYTGIISRVCCRVIYNYLENKRLAVWVLYPLFNFICLFDYFGNGDSSASLAIIAVKK